MSAHNDHDGGVSYAYLEGIGPGRSHFNFVSSRDAANRYGFDSTILEEGLPVTIAYHRMPPRLLPRTSVKGVQL